MYFAYQLITGNIYSLKHYVASYMLTRYGMSYVWIVLIFLYTALLIPIYCRFEEHKKKVFFAVLVLYIVYEVMYFLGIGTDSKLLNSSFFYIIPYGVITFMGMNYSEFSDRTKKRIIFWAFGVFSVLFIVYWIKTGSIQDVQITKYPPRAYYLSYGLGVSYLLMYICEHHHSRIYENNFIRFVSSHSLGIYLCHVMALEFYELLRLPQIWLLKLIVVFVTSVLAVFIWTEVMKR